MEITGQSDHDYVATATGAGAADKIGPVVPDSADDEEVKPPSRKPLSGSPSLATFNFDGPLQPPYDDVTDMSLPQKRRKMSSDHGVRSSRFQPPPGFMDPSSTDGHHTEDHGDHGNHVVVDGHYGLRVRKPVQPPVPQPPPGTRPHRASSASQRSLRRSSESSRGASARPLSYGNNSGNKPRRKSSDAVFINVNRSMRERRGTVSYKEETDEDEFDDMIGEPRKRTDRSRSYENSYDQQRRSSRRPSHPPVPVKQEPSEADFNAANEALSGNRRLTRRLAHIIPPEVQSAMTTDQGGAPDGAVTEGGDYFDENQQHDGRRRSSARAGSSNVNGRGGRGQKMEEDGDQWESNEISNQSTRPTPRLKLTFKGKGRAQAQEAEDGDLPDINEEEQQQQPLSSKRKRADDDNGVDGDVDVVDQNDEEEGRVLRRSSRRLRSNYAEDDDGEDGDEYKDEGHDDEEEDDFEEGDEEELSGPEPAKMNDFIVPDDDEEVKRRKPNHLKRSQLNQRTTRRSLRSQSKLNEARRQSERNGGSSRAKKPRNQVISDDEEDDDMRIYQGGETTEGDTNGTSGARRLRPRKGVDYTRQLEPGKGWDGRPLEAFHIQKDALNRINSALGKRSSGGGGRDRRDKFEEDVQFNYKPGRFNRSGTGRFAGSDDDADELAGRRRSDIGPSRGNTIEPININEILRVQEQALLKDLPEEERKSFEESAKIFRSSGGKDLADTDPANAGTVNFDAIGGLEEHIRSLKEMVVMPLLYPEVFSGFQITPPRGVLFHGPPGTGKTLMARALAASCSTSTQKVAFFMRKGADVLSKWVGESERQLKLLFEQAKTYQPSIIFFDEIDGLAPVRSSKQDQIHASIVSTLLALMDGLDSRGQVVVIGATNRVDAIDPALRRPGRFDREFYFPLPEESARRKILSIATAKWTPPPSDALLDDLAKATRGYCGADVKALCTEAALNAVRRSYPEIYESGHKLQINVGDIRVVRDDFAKSIKAVIPSTQRSSTIYSAPIPPHVLPLVADTFKLAEASLDVLTPLLRMVAEAHATTFAAQSDTQVGPSTSAGVDLSLPLNLTFGKSVQPRMIVCGPPGMGQRIIGPAILERLESCKFHVQALDLASLLHDSARSPDAAIIQLLHELKRHRPAVLYIPDIDTWWESLPESAKSVFSTLIQRDVSDPVMIVATCEKSFRELHEDLKSLIRGRSGVSDKVQGWKRVIEAQKPDELARKEFFASVIQAARTPPTPINQENEPSRHVRAAPLTRAPSPPPRELTQAETDALFDHDENLRRQLRMELRFIIQDIKRLKKFSDFHRPVDPDAYPDYYQVVTHPMDLETIFWRVNTNRYSVLDEFVDDFKCIIQSAYEFNEPESQIVLKALDLFDTFMTYINTLKRREPEFVWELKQSALRCKIVNEQRKKAGKPVIERSNPIQFQKDESQFVDNGNQDKGKETARQSRRIRGEQPDLSLAEVSSLEPLGLKSGSKPRRAIIDDDDEEEAVAGPSNAEGEDGDGGSNVVVELPGAATDVEDHMDMDGVGGDSGNVVEGSSMAVDSSEEAASKEAMVVEVTSENISNAPPAIQAPTPISAFSNQFNVESLLATSVDSKHASSSSTPNGVASQETHNVEATLLSPQKASGSNSNDSAMKEPEPPKEFILDESALGDFERRLIHETRNCSVADLEGLAIALSGVVVKNLSGVLDRAVHSWTHSSSMDDD
ncbi:hypothetical protein HDU76_002579 [Blyttiomyces sp. JEL0837]|nr:hypothetical protein HDU76_002579 [Blyttiomyces sp. JEL0837]